jgi:hypothetical protein
MTTQTKMLPSQLGEPHAFRGLAGRPLTVRLNGTDCGLRDPFGNHLRIGTPKEGPIELPDPAQFAAENTA